ncbi:hypothetical protein ABE073_04530 [Lederbergia citrisecunda]|uniref:hypothetical protein n=1 Tax=Lederbergia citrisecunda TaxID=2833583 RepID=UPI003D2D8FDB
MRNKEEIKFNTEPLKLDKFKVKKGNTEVWSDGFNVKTILYKSITGRGITGLIITKSIEEASHWLAEEDEDAINYQGVKAGNLYSIEYDDTEQEYYIVDEMGSHSMIYLAHEGSFVTVVEDQHYKE